ncbi:hypothetical protein [Peribacillus deserti]|uniref:Uncharacterized protein n=1 Tax=Peribacillus deserti TaxID=673318 RepID=A0A2N5LZQ2_9BACI|nr:hypothetical protein [Peribacillus deserti]PLT27599.1 hypothetical protein CUU66_22910 [Peribacillus deserti]
MRPKLQRRICFHLMYLARSLYGIGSYNQLIGTYNRIIAADKKIIVTDKKIIARFSKIVPPHWVEHPAN